MPATVFTAASMRSVTSVSMLSRRRAGFVVVTDTVGHLDARIAVDAEREERDAADDRERRDQHRGEDRPADADLSELLHGVRSRVRASRWTTSRRRRVARGWRRDALALLHARDDAHGVAGCRGAEQHDAQPRAVLIVDRRTRGTSSCSRPRSRRRAARSARARCGPDRSAPRRTSPASAPRPGWGRAPRR